MERDKRALERLQKSILGVLARVEERKMSYPEAANRVVEIREEIDRLVNGSRNGLRPRRLPL